MKLAMIAVSLVLAASAQAQSLKEKYELSERCGKLGHQPAHLMLKAQASPSLADFAVAALAFEHD